jgi:hypothetical protein
MVGVVGKTAGDCGEDELDDADDSEQDDPTAAGGEVGVGFGVLGWPIQFCMKEALAFLAAGEAASSLAIERFGRIPVSNMRRGGLWLSVLLPSFFQIDQTYFNYTLYHPSRHDHTKIQCVP